MQSLIDAAQRERPDRAPELPLVRLRVDYTGFSTINTQRFGQKFVGKVANPNDIVLWQKAPARRQKVLRGGWRRGSVYGGLESYVCGIFCGCRGWVGENASVVASRSAQTHA